MLHDTHQLVLGIDFGTDSCRALVVDAENGKERSVGTAEYPRWKQSAYCNAKANKYRQHPRDYMESLTEAVRQALAQLDDSERDAIRGLSIDTTGSTPAITDADGTPLALLSEFENDPDAMFILWKDHTAVAEAEEINTLIAEQNLPYNKYSGGTYSSEWVWAKVLHVLRHNERVRDAACSWVEHCDWMTSLLTGSTRPDTIRRSRCAAGHKAMWHADWGLPSEQFLNHLDPKLASMRPHLYGETFTSDTPAGQLTPEWAARLGLRAGIPVGVGAIDAHMGAVGASVSDGVLVSIIGTSTCDIMVSRQDKLATPCLKGISSQADGSVLPGYIGIEAGQAAFGDIFAWFRNMLSWTYKALSPSSEVDEAVSQMLVQLSQEAADVEPSADALVALDWMNGRRTPYADQNLKGAIAGITLSSTAPEIYRALVESTAFGLRRIIEHMREQGLEINAMNAVGGISKKSPLVMQVLADVTGMEMRVIESENACALGSAMFAAVVAGIYDSIEDAERHMRSDITRVYVPDVSRRDVYNTLYHRYLMLGNTAEQIAHLKN